MLAIVGNSIKCGGWMGLSKRQLFHWNVCHFAGSFESEQEDEHGETSESTSDILVQPGGGPWYLWIIYIW
jgi:hypothetical protein